MQWFRKWSERRRLKQRALFAYHDGARVRRADPAEIWRKLLNHPDWDLAETMQEAHANHEPGVSVAVRVLSEIFDVQPWDDAAGAGLTTWELLDLVRQFEEYLSALKKNTSPLQMPLLHSAYGPPNDSVPNSHTTLDDSMSSTAASSSIPGESSTAEATSSSEPSPTES